MAAVKSPRYRSGFAPGVRMYCLKEIKLASDATSVPSPPMLAYGLGIAGMFQTCGSVCAMMMLAGLKNSDGNMESPASKFATFELGQEMAKRFEQKNTSMICSVLRGTDGKTDRLRSCRGCVMDCAQIVEEVLFPGEFEPYDGPSEL